MVLYNSSFESPKLYLFAQYIIPALLRYTILPKSNPISYHTEASGCIFFYRGCKYTEQAANLLVTFQNTYYALSSACTVTCVNTHQGQKRILVLGFGYLFVFIKSHIHWVGLHDIWKSCTVKPIHVDVQNLMGGGGWG